MKSCKEFIVQAKGELQPADIVVARVTEQLMRGQLELEEWLAALETGNSLSKAYRYDWNSPSLVSGSYLAFQGSLICVFIYLFVVYLFIYFLFIYLIYFLFIYFLFISYLFISYLFISYMFIYFIYFFLFIYYILFIFLFLLFNYLFTYLFIYSFYWVTVISIF